MARFNNAITFGNAFNITTNSPIDSRMRVEREDDLTSGSTWSDDKAPLYKGMMVVVMETSDIWVLKDVEQYENLNVGWTKIGHLDEGHGILISGSTVSVDTDAIRGDLIDDDNISTATTYSSEKIMNIVNGVSFAVLVVDVLPESGLSRTIYFVPKEYSGETSNIYEEYLYVNESWEKIGDTEVDFSDYYTKEEVNALSGTLINYVDSGFTNLEDYIDELANIVDTKQDRLIAGDYISISANTISVIGLDEIQMVIAANINELANRITEVESGKQDNLIAGAHIEIDSANTISSIYVSSDFEISGLTDSQGLREYWSSKQDALHDGHNIVIDSSNTISATGYIHNSQVDSFAEGYSIEEFEGFDMINKADGIRSHAEGGGTRSTGIVSHAEGGFTKADGDTSHAEGSYTIADGGSSHAEGDMTFAAGDQAHAEGGALYLNFTVAILDNEIKESNNISQKYFCIIGGQYIEDALEYRIFFCDGTWSYRTLAINKIDISSIIGVDGTFAFDVDDEELMGDLISEYGGYVYCAFSSTVAHGFRSHAEGSSTKAYNEASHAEGYGTIANNVAEHAQGMYNLSHNSSESSASTLHSIGIGSVTERKNAVEVMANGDVYVVEIGEYDGSNPESSVTLQTVINNKQDILMPGNGISIDSSNTISTTLLDDLSVSTANTYSSDKIIQLVSNKQDVLEAGKYISISGDVISVSGLDEMQMVIASHITDLRTNKQDKLTAGDNITISGNVISAENTTYVSSDFDISGLSDSQGLRTTWSGKQDKLVADSGITISGDNISVKIGNGLSFSQNGELTASIGEIPIATKSSTGVTQIGDNINVTEGGVISVPMATTAITGVVKIGTGLSVQNDGTLSVSVEPKTYYAGTGVTIGNDDKISANSNSTTVEEIQISNGVIDATGIWDDDVIPSGTSIQDILVALLCKEVFPGDPTKPSLTGSSATITNSNGTEIGGGSYITAGSVVSVGKMTSSVKSYGTFSNSGGKIKNQRSPYNVAWNYSGISKTEASGFSGYTTWTAGGTSEYSAEVAKQTGITVLFGSNWVKNSYSGKYSAPDTSDEHLPYTSLKHPTRSKTIITTASNVWETIWNSGTTSSSITKTIYGTYPIFYKVNSNGGNSDVNIDTSTSAGTINDSAFTGTLLHFTGLATTATTTDTASSKVIMYETNFNENGDADRFSLICPKKFLYDNEEVQRRKAVICQYNDQSGLYSEVETNLTGEEFTINLNTAYSSVDYVRFEKGGSGSGAGKYKIIFKNV